MKNHIIYLSMMIAVLMYGCSTDITPDKSIDAYPRIYPDYIGVTLPTNIAPLNMYIDEIAKDYAVKLRCGQTETTIRAKNGDLTIPFSLWREMTSNTGDSIEVTVMTNDGDEWTSYRPFGMYISPDSIDRTLVYRLLPPLYGTWRKIGIYQRNLENYDEKPIYENTAYHGNCVNCHSFCNRDAQRMLFHLRGNGGGTYLYDQGQELRLDTKTDSTISNFTYPYWHPSGRYIAFSVNDIFQIFHTSDPDRTEVIDDASDIVVYDIKENIAISTPAIKSAKILETFPAFSPDGKTLYYCSAIRPDSLPEHYKDVRYSLCSISFDPERATFGSTIDTIYNANDTTLTGCHKSMVMPRPSPDGKKLVATLGNYGNFMIWHKEADLWIYDIDSKSWQKMGSVNSDDVESYHSWSGNSRWLVFSSRRDDGLYTRPYIVHVSEDGKIGKPLMLPQEKPKKYYACQKNSYNIPELVNGEVNLDSRQIINLIEQQAKKVNYRSVVE